MIGATLHPGLPEALRPAAARLYWQAFGPKLGRILGPEPQALLFLARVMRANQAIIALGPKGELLGLAGFRTASGGFASGEASDLTHVYGQVGSLWRGALLARLPDQPDPDSFLLDGICVAPEARGKGLGTALIEAICDEARLRGKASVRLGVVESNRGAIALYEKLGFRTTSRQKIGALRLAFRFHATLTMHRDLV